MLSIGRFGIAAFATMSLGLVVNAAHAATDCSVVVMDRLLPYKVSSGTDADVNSAIGNLVSGYYGAISDSTSSASSSDPKMAALLTAVSAGTAGMASIAESLPAVIGAIDEARDDADDLYMSLTTVRGHEAAFFPSFGTHSDAYNEGLIASLRGVSGRVVPWIFGVDTTVDPATDRIEVNLFDYDSASRDDILGQFIFFRKFAGMGPQAAIAGTANHGGVLYIAEYRVIPVTCHPAWDVVLKSMYQGTALNTLDATVALTAVSNANLGLAKPELAAQGISF